MHDNPTTSTASDKNIEQIHISTPTSSEPNTGYRIVDMDNLETIFSCLSYTSFENSNELKLSEILSKKRKNIYVLFVFAKFYLQLLSGTLCVQING